MSDDGVFHDEIEIEDFEYDEEAEQFTYPCPCGDLFTITKVSLDRLEAYSNFHSQPNESIASDRHR